MTHPLDDILGTNEQKAIDGDYGVEIPDDPEAKNLQLIVDLALKSYKEQMDDIVLLEPKYRTAAYKVALDYLTQAKDAKHKLDRLDIDYKKLHRFKSSQKPNKGSQKTQDDTDGVSRGELHERLRAVK